MADEVVESEYMKVADEECGSWLGRWVAGWNSTAGIIDKASFPSEEGNFDIVDSIQRSMPFNLW